MFIGEVTTLRADNSKLHIENSSLRSRVRSLEEEVEDLQKEKELGGVLLYTMRIVIHAYLGLLKGVVCHPIRVDLYLATRDLYPLCKYHVDSRELGY